MIKKVLITILIILIIASVRIIGAIYIHHSQDKETSILNNRTNARNKSLETENINI